MRLILENESFKTGCVWLNYGPRDVINESGQKYEIGLPVAIPSEFLGKPLEHSYILLKNDQIELSNYIITEIQFISPLKYQQYCYSLDCLNNNNLDHNKKNLEVVANESS